MAAFLWLLMLLLAMGETVVWDFGGAAASASAVTPPELVHAHGTDLTPEEQAALQGKTVHFIDGESMAE